MLFLLHENPALHILFKVCDDQVSQRPSIKSQSQWKLLQSPVHKSADFLQTVSQDKQATL